MKKLGDVLLEIKAGPKMPFGVIESPNLLTVPQAARILGVTRAAIHDRLKRGTLTFVVWYGEKMIPAREVAEAYRKKKEAR